jgi:glucose-6-phosphate-specific signal transduction histidine kinase
MDVVAEVRMVLGSAVSLAARKRVRLEFAVPPGLEVHTDPRLFRSMLRDLLKQALDQATDGSVLIGARRQDSQVIITVCDDGIGQDQADQEAARRRTGELLLRQGATMRIDVRPGQGTTVIVCLPDSVSATSASPGGSPDQGGAATHSRTPDGMAERGPNHD